jgi:hypothetical protein
MELFEHNHELKHFSRAIFKQIFYLIVLLLYFVCVLMNVEFIADLLTISTSTIIALNVIAVYFLVVVIFSSLLSDLYVAIKYYSVVNNLFLIRNTNSEEYPKKYIKFVNSFYRLKNPVKNYKKDSSISFLTDSYEIDRFQRNMDLFFEFHKKKLLLRTLSFEEIERSDVCSFLRYLKNKTMAEYVGINVLRFNVFFKNKFSNIDDYDKELFEQTRMDIESHIKRVENKNSLFGFFTKGLDALKDYLPTLIILKTVFDIILQRANQEDSLTLFLNFLKFIINNIS